MKNNQLTSNELLSNDRFALVAVSLCIQALEGLKREWSWSGNEGCREIGLDGPGLSVDEVDEAGYRWGEAVSTAQKLPLTLRFCLLSRFNLRTRCGDIRKARSN